MSKVILNPVIVRQTTVNDWNDSPVDLTILIAFVIHDKNIGLHASIGTELVVVRIHSSSLPIFPQVFNAKEYI